MGDCLKVETVRIAPSGSTGPLPLMMTGQKVIRTMASLYANRKLGNMGNWQARHNDTVQRVLSRIPGDSFSTLTVLQLSSWAGYANAHKTRYGSLIGDDGVIGEYWLQVGLGLRGLLNGETGALDCGTLDAFILDTLSENGIDLASHGL